MLSLTFFVYKKDGGEVMLKKMSIIILTLCISTTMSACSIGEDIIQSLKKDETDWIETGILDESVVVQNNKAEHLKEETIEYLKKEQEKYYNYQKIEEEYKGIYVEMHYVISHMKTDYILTYCEPTAIDRIFTCMMNDHPEIFWCDGYSYSLNEKNGEKYVRFSGTYTKTSDERIMFQQNIDEVIQEIINNAPSDEYGKVKYVYEYLIGNTIYDTEAMESQNILSTLLYQHSVCQGYAKTIQYLLQLMGMEATLVNGTVHNDVPHAWNLIKVNGDYYWMDATWGDSSYKIANYEQYGIEPKIDYYYLSMTSNQMLMDHKIDYLVPYPDCDSTEDNYFVREGLYFHDVDYDKMHEIVSKAVERGESAVVFQCQDVNCYKKMYTALVIEKGIFNVIQSDNLLYETSDKKLNITIWF